MALNTTPAGIRHGNRVPSGRRLTDSTGNAQRARECARDCEQIVSYELDAALVAHGIMAAAAFNARKAATR